MGRLLGPSEYGALASIYSILYIISIVPQSASVSIVKFISSAKTDTEKTHVYNGVYSLVQKVAFVGVVFLFILTPFLQHFLHLNSIFAPIWIVPVFYFSIITTVNQSTLQGELSFIGIVVTNLVSSVSKLLLGVVFILIGWSLGGAIFAVALGVFFAYMLSYKYVYRYISKTDTDKDNFDMTQFLKYSGPVVIQALAFTSLFTIDLVMVKHFFPEFDAGIYAALSTLGKVIFFAASPITAVMFPLVSKKKSQGSSVLSLFKISLAITAFASFSIVIFYYAFPQLTITLLYGKKYIAAVSLLPWMGLFIAIYTIGQQLVNFFLSIDDTNAIIFPSVAAVFQIILLWFFHQTLLQVIQISLTLMCFVTLLLLIKLAYNKEHIYANKK